MTHQRRRFGHRARFLALVGLLAITAPLLAGCGHSHYDDTGDIVVINETHLTTTEDLLDFFVARFGDPFSGDILGGTLGPNSARSLGSFTEDYYDAQGNLSGGQLVEWFDEFVGDGYTTEFVAQ